ncbi:hypothetical protein [Flavobacterium macrobrachii]|uniref:Uncharacterized protein n=1 Tax=Flavobacterium macrobrachii TaxID=591204 RepID=A0ABS2CTJ8_9FLAO|nr:hypothetical protein [Flavobacterium macrobrachii]MBM6498290.1 hypothetical protein [Flavobacterium macrobrachii]
MKQKLLFTTFIFFLPILQKLIIINPLSGIQLDFKFFIATVVVLSALLIMAIVSFCVAVISWINSGFKWAKLIPCLMSLLAILCIYYSIKSVINSKTRRIKNTLQSIPNTLIKGNIELV